MKLKVETRFSGMLMTSLLGGVVVSGAAGAAIWGSPLPPGLIPPIPIDLDGGTAVQGSARLQVVNRGEITGVMSAGFASHNEAADGETLEVLDTSGALINYREEEGSSLSTTGGRFFNAKGNIEAWAAQGGSFGGEPFSFGLKGYTTGTAAEGKDVGDHYGVYGFAGVELPQEAGFEDLRQYGVYGATDQQTGIAGYFVNEYQAQDYEFAYSQALYVKGQGSNVTWGNFLGLTGPFVDDEHDNDPRAYVATIEGTNPNFSKILAIYNSASEADEDTTYIGFLTANGDGTATYRAGAITGLSDTGANGVTYGSKNADFAEYLPKRDPSEVVEPGDVVAVVDGRVTRDTRGAHYLQVVSSGPVVAGNMPKPEQRRSHVAVALLGQAPVKVRGKVRPGDYILAGERGDGTGIAMAPELMTPELFQRAVGRALAGSEEAGLKKVKVAVGLGWNDAYGYMKRQDRRIVELEAALERQRLHLEAALAAREDQLERLAAEVAELRRLVAQTVEGRQTALVAP